MYYWRSFAIIGDIYRSFEIVTGRWVSMAIVTDRYVLLATVTYRKGSSSYEVVIVMTGWRSLAILIYCYGPIDFMTDYRLSLAIVSDR